MKNQQVAKEITDLYADLTIPDSSQRLDELQNMIEAALDSMERKTAQKCFSIVKKKIPDPHTNHDSCTDCAMIQLILHYIREEFKLKEK